MLQADSSQSRPHARLAKRDRFVASDAGLQSIQPGETKMNSFKALAAAVLLSAAAATPAFAQASAGDLYTKNLRDSGYNPKNDFNPNGTMRAAACRQVVSRLARVEGSVCVGRRRRLHLRRPLARLL
jgi:hypothetical protein